MDVKICLFVCQFLLCVTGSPLATQVPPEKGEIKCGSHQIFKKCERCDNTCSNLNPICFGSCRSGCFCEDGFVKAPNGQCVVLKDCPKAEITIGVREISIEDCNSDEEFLTCGWCEPDCSNPEPQCSSQSCTRGCLCRPPLVRHYTGQCVERKYCLSQKCNPNEEFVCKYGCEVRCDNHSCVPGQRCSLGCHCKLGLLRDITGQCVTPDKCTKFNLARNISNATSIS